MKYSCYYIIHLGCLMGFTMHFYIIFGTNLLTQSPMPVSVFSLVLVFRRKGISNGVQTEWNLREREFWNERDPGDLDPKSRKLRGGHEVAPSTLVGPLLVHRRTSSSYIYISIYPKNFGEHNRSGVPPPEASVATENQSRPVPAPCRRGNPSPVAIFIIPVLSMMRRE